RTPLCRLERHGRFLAARRARRQRLDPFTRQRCTGRTAGPFALAGFAPLRLVLEVLVGEELLLSCRPDEVRAGASSGSVSARAPALRVACRPASNRTSAF